MGRRSANRLADYVCKAFGAAAARVAALPTEGVVASFRLKATPACQAVKQLGKGVQFFAHKESPAVIRLG